MDIIENIADAIEQEPSSDMEAMCREEVAMEMRSQRRMLTADEIEDIVEDIVEDEAIADLSVERVDEGEITVTEPERANIPDEDIVLVEDGDDEDVEGVVIGGRFARLNVVPDRSASVIAKSISRHSEALAHMANVNEGINLKSLYHPVPDVAMPCPVCASRNVTPVWYDRGEVIAHCNSCDHEFDASVEDVAHATLAERTVEDIDILPEYDVFGSVWLENDGYGYEVYAEGELVDSGAVDTYEEVLERFDDIADAYDEIGEGTQVDFSSGDSEMVEIMADDDVYFGAGRKASRIRLARMVADGAAFIDNSMRKELSFTAGQVFESQSGSVIVDSVMPDGIYATMISCAPDGHIAERVARFTPKQLDSMLSADGYRL